MARLPAASESAAVNAIVVSGTTYYLSIHSADPGTTGANEITGYTGNRPSIVFGSGGIASSTTGQTFAAMPAEAGGVPYIGVWTAATGGTYLGGGATTGLSAAIGSGATITFAIGAVTVAIS
jgi:hypothetical protein